MAQQAKISFEIMKLTTKTSYFRPTEKCIDYNLVHIKLSMHRDQW